ncbi:MAG: SDR family oxidoreductase [Gammaproteobacteria bacterium]|nr:SDR family oxidoreductase [Gammaproteobacteria bacterium]
MKTALITGGSKGVGLATAKKLHELDFSVIIAGRNLADLKSAASEIGARCRYLQVDLSSPENLQPFIDSVDEDALDLLVNNAGICDLAPIADVSVEFLSHSMNVNFISPVILTKGLLPKLKKAKGCVINVSSAITYRGAPRYSSYAASKGALEAWTKSISIELISDGVRVNAVCPGAVKTQMADGIPDEVITEIEKTIPAGRFAQPEEIAEAIVSLFNCKYSIGTVWNVDGGVGA